MGLENYKRLEESFKLYEVPRNSIITLCTMDSSDLFIRFHHVDGAYSLCTILETNETCHLSASTEVYVWSQK